ncbi:chemotaxis protein CheY [Microbacterium sp. CPCC 204701]|uniref:chemotaxis protein CheY n=1 Tax=Microbacterium sp. CPCC 204701 TaxID=2493084 RepID=UPI000FD98134|nr:chemotaxis protein CheY [Microbacterium sp. CPCC 204701]
MSALPPVAVRWREIPTGAERRATAWALLQSMLPPGAELDNPCARCGGPHGPVIVTNEPFVASVSYAGALAVAAVSSRADGVTGLGVDAEPLVDPRREAAGMRGIIDPGRAATLRDWTRIEAALKADGRGLRVEPATVVVREAAASWTAVLPDGVMATGWEPASPPGVLVSVAVRRA